jgi:hypothetical protein
MDSKDTMDKSNPRKEKRKSPRFYMDYPLEYRVLDAPQARGGIVVDGSKRGLRIHSVENIPVGTKLKIAVIFPKEFQMTNFEVTAEIIWKDLYLTEDWNGFQYGLKFILISKNELRKLKELLSEQYRT